MIFLTFSRVYPRQSLLMVAALLLAGLAEGSSLSLMLPLISFASAVQERQDPGAGGLLADQLHVDRATLAHAFADRETVTGLDDLHRDTDAHQYLPRWSTSTLTVSCPTDWGR